MPLVRSRFRRRLGVSLSAQIKKHVTLRNKHGLHARPATVFVELAKNFTSDIAILYDGQEVDGKSIISILTLGLGQGAKITIKAIGKDAQKAADDLANLVKSSNSFD